MSLSVRVLGAAGRDNAALMTVDSGQGVERLLFDCGDGCPQALPFADLRAVDALFFSHLHMDHVAGFDAFFRATFDRTDRPNVVFGPPGTAATLHHRFRGFLWNLHAGLRATWRMTDVYPDRLHTVRFELAEAFAHAHDEGSRPADGTLRDAPGYAVDAQTLDHGTPCLAYRVREKPRRNFDPGRLAALGLTPGPWLKQVRDPAGPAEVEVGGVRRPAAGLRAALLTETPGDAAAYLTDFALDGPAVEQLTPWLRGVRTVVCECQYSESDAHLAERNRHMTAAQAAALALWAGVGELVLFHLSDRYTADGWAGLLREARGLFPAARLPDGWGESAG